MKVEEIAQWVIDHRYPKSELQSVSDHEMYQEVKRMIIESQPMPLSDEDLEVLKKSLFAKHMNLYHDDMGHSAEAMSDEDFDLALDDFIKAYRDRTGGGVDLQEVWDAAREFDVVLINRGKVWKFKTLKDYLTQRNQHGVDLPSEDTLQYILECLDEKNPWEPEKDDEARRWIKSHINQQNEKP